ncbi:glucose 1-dehydrogenase [Streptomyces sp. TP-A0874]|uniref:glucose 1-dehydrogenase n=1 Tax=Streptomyces sp. TP-A0874 TaxID=549819 RepID=UPI000852D4FF|nr:glucose 1-dehydrogenase [Streptomyces sp. TP-A0874]
MRALTVQPLRPDTLEVRELPEPQPGDGELLVDAVAVGVCGTDKEILAGDYGAAPPGHERLVLGHESLGRVRRAPAGSGFASGDLVVGVVRRPDPVPCGACAHGEFDMCRNGRFTERGISGLDGYAAQTWCVESDYAVPLPSELEQVGVLLEPTSVVAKAWEQVERVGARAWFEPRRALVTGAGPIGLLAALLGLERGLEVHVLDQVTEGPKPELVHDLGAAYHCEDIDDALSRVEPDIVIEATGAGRLIMESFSGVSNYGIVCLTGVSATGGRLPVDAGALNRDMVLGNDAVVGSVNANLRHYRKAVESLGRADQGWLDRLITRRVPLGRAPEAFEHRAEDVKVVITMDGT